MLLVLPVLVFVGLGFVWRRSKIVTENDFIGGDGGPMIVLQADAVAHWQGAANFDNSLMNGGTVETDYDVICAVSDAGYLLKRYNRDMLVLDDSEWGAYLSVFPSGMVAVVQSYGVTDGIAAIMQRLTSARPSRSFSMNVQDISIRLLVGAEDGAAGSYGYKDASITPGTKRCDVYSFHDALVVTINSAYLPHCI